MKLTQEDLKKIIREELEKSNIEEGLFDFFTGKNKEEAPPRLVKGDDPRVINDPKKFQPIRLNISTKHTFDAHGKAEMLGYTPQEIMAVDIALYEFPELLNVDGFGGKFPIGQKVPVPKKIMDLQRMSKREKKAYRRLLDHLKQNDRDLYADEVGIRKI